MRAKRFSYLSLGVLALSVAFAACFQAAGRPAVAAATPVTPTVAEQLQSEFADVAARVNPAVVNIDVERPANLPQGYRYFGPGDQIPPEFRQFFNPPFGPGFGGPDFGNPGDDNGGGMSAPMPRGRQGAPKGGKGGGGPKSMAAGSGFIIDAAKGYIVTNAHVAKDATRIGVTVFDGASYEAKLIGYDPRTDVAVIQVPNPKNLQEIAFADSDQVRIGHICLAFGQPEGLKYTVTQGIISATGRSDLGIIGGPGEIAGYESFLQTDAAVNPGNSGGPLTDIYGKVIGMNTAIATAGVAQFGGISFAIPANIIKRVVPQLIEKGEVVYGWIGVSISDLSNESDETAKKYGDIKGAYVHNAESGQPAEAAGIKEGDVIVGFGGKPTPDVATLRMLVANAPIGSSQAVDVVRLTDGKAKKETLQIKIAKQPKNLASVMGGSLKTDIGLTVQTITPDVAEGLGLSADEKGVIVSDVQQDSRADKAGIAVYDVITQVKYKNDSWPIASSDDFSSALSHIPSKDTFTFLVTRHGESHVVAIK
jgi:serine protease Do